MIIGKMWKAFRAQLNKVANYFWGADPIAQMQLEYDDAVNQLKTGKEGLAMYRALVERVGQQVKNEEKHVANLTAKIKAYLQSGDRETAAKFALELKKAQDALTENQTQLQMHEQAYQNNLLKIQRAGTKIQELKQRISKYDADLKMSRAEAELADIAQTFNMDVTTDFGQIEQVVQDQINMNRAKARVAADLSGEGLEDIQRELAMEKNMAEDALKDFEVEMGLITPKTSAPVEDTKELGPATKQTTKES